MLLISVENISCSSDWVNERSSTTDFTLRFDGLIFVENISYISDWVEECSSPSGVAFDADGSLGLYWTFLVNISEFLSWAVEFSWVDERVFVKSSLQLILLLVLCSCFFELSI